MVVAGITLCSSWQGRLAVLVAAGGMGILNVRVVGFRPESIRDMHGGTAKDACLIACAWVVWKLHTDDTKSDSGLAPA